MNAYRCGNVGLVNAVGTGVADDKAIYPFVPDMIKVLSWPGADPAQRADVHLRPRDDRKYVLEHLHELVVKSTNESGGYGMLMGHQAPQKEREEFAERSRPTRATSSPSRSCS
jgi:uncharacterized circularly permuted ATP-grasp superfamily protein